MKFAKTLDDEAIPEWKANYFDYKHAKKKLKAIEKALRSVPTDAPSGTIPPNGQSSLRDAPVFSLLRRRQTFTGSDRDQQLRPDTSDPLLRSHLATGADFTPSIPPKAPSETPAKNVRIDERTTLKAQDAPGGDHSLTRMRSYGSIIGSPPKSGDVGLSRVETTDTKAPSLRLPVPALDEDADYDRPVSPGADADKVGELPKTPSAAHPHSPLGFRPQLTTSNSASRVQNTPSQISRTFSTPGIGRQLSSRFTGSNNGGARSWRFANANPSGNDIALEAYRELDFRKTDFFSYLDKELAKINAFYTSKEELAVKQLNILRDQLHIMRERRLAEIEHQKRHGHAPGASPKGEDDQSKSIFRIPFVHHQSHVETSASRALSASVDFAQDALHRVRTRHVGKTSQAMGQLGTPRVDWTPHPDQRDYAARPAVVTHHTAKRKLKTALAEYYRSLELLKSYAATNRTAFRKIVKKYDKTVQSRKKGQYMDENVNKAHFVMSDSVDTLMVDTESLYSRYFERGNHKIAVSKLRAKSAKAGEYTSSVATTSFLLGVGMFMAIYGIVDGSRMLRSPDDVVRIAATFLLQLYGGYFLMVLLTGLFVAATAIFTHFKVNYPFVFELEPKSRLDWRELAEIPAFFFFLLGGAMWLNFSIYAGGVDMIHWWFVILIVVSGVIFFLPAKVFFYKTRLFFLTTLFRLFFSGFFSVEFRDFFLGDMFCSLTYALGNIELFFCVYARNWTDDIHQCTSSESRLLGFFSALPGIWRAIQCVRRYVVTGAAFPHLFNFGKYCCTILQYVSLSVYRIDRSPGAKAFFIVAACLNSVYCSVWDVNYDWSLGNFRQKRHRGLRMLLAYRKQVWIYYFAMIVDPILRFNWIFYVIYIGDIQHATLVSFLVALSEVFRRGLWTLFRVENEHCTNIFRQKATRDFDLPYEVLTGESTDVSASTSDHGDEHHDDTSKLPSPDAGVEAGGNNSSPNSSPGEAQAGNAAEEPHADSPIARALYRVGTTLRMGHQQDYVRKKKVDDPPPADSDDDESDEDDE